MLTLGQLIDAISRCSPLDEDAQPKTVRYDFGYMAPTRLTSWRGIYSELALGYSETGDSMSVERFLKELNGAVGKDFDGYKRGKYEMTRDTPIHVANYSQVCSTVISGIIEESRQIILTTAYSDEP